MLVIKKYPFEVLLNHTVNYIEDTSFYIDDQYPYLSHKYWTAKQGMQSFCGHLGITFYGAVLQITQSWNRMQ